MKQKEDKQMIKKLKQELNIASNIDFLEELCKKREEEIRINVGSTEEYKEYISQIKEIDNEIKLKFKEYWEIMQMIEKREAITYSIQDLYKKQMYKRGIYDGIKFLSEGTTK